MNYLSNARGHISTPKATPRWKASRDLDPAAVPDNAVFLELGAHLSKKRRIGQSTPILCMRSLALDSDADYLLITKGLWFQGRSIWVKRGEKEDTVFDCLYVPKVNTR